MFETSRPSDDAQYGEHVGSSAVASQTHERFSHRWAASIAMPRPFPSRRGAKRLRARRAAGANGLEVSLADYPGFPLLGAELQALLLRAEDGDVAARPALLEKAADVCNVFIGLDLLQYVFMPSAEEDGSEPIEIDLIAPAENTAAIAWFSIDEAGYDEFRDAVTLFGDVADVLNPPIVLDVDDDSLEDDSSN
jgi:hypothetical protein